MRRAFQITVRDRKISLSFDDGRLEFPPAVPLKLHEPRDPYHSSRSNKRYALTQQSREGSTCEDRSRSALSSFQLRSYIRSVIRFGRLAPPADSLQQKKTTHASSSLLSVKTYRSSSSLHLFLTYVNRKIAKILVKIFAKIAR